MIESPVTVGIWQHLPLPMVSRYLAYMGWQWIVLDMQHGPMNFETAYECVHAAWAAGATPLVRVAIGNPFDVQRALDIGAQGVVVPMVRGVEEAEALAQAAKYPPDGRRSLGGDAALHYGPEYPEQANRSTKLLVQIEDAAGLEQVENIMAVEGVDGCFVGPTDLALSLGMSRHDYEDNPDHQDALLRIVHACRRHGKLACCNSYSLDDFDRRKHQGFAALTLRSDVDLLMDSGRKLFEQLKNLAQ